MLTPRLPVNATNQPGSEHCGYARELFSVQGNRVTLDAQRGWQCTCTPNAEGLQCTHVEEAQAFRKARGVPLEQDTIELELSAAQLQELSRAADAEQTAIPPTGNVAAPQRLRRYSPWATLAVAAAMSAISSGITYLATARAPTSRTAEPHGFSQALVASPTSQAALPREVPVKFVNPFDAMETFEFPPGTSATDARDTVAELLLNRARDRQSAAEMRLRGRKSAERERPQHAMRVAEAG
jgi:hypothetical protein